MSYTQSTVQHAKISERKRRLYKAYFEVLQPRSERLDLDLADYLVDFSQDYLRSFPKILSIGLTFMLMCLNVITIAISSSRRSFVLLDIEERRAIVLQWEHAHFQPIREFVRFLKIVVVLGFYEHPEVMQRIGFTPDPWIEEAKTRRLETYGKEIKIAEIKEIGHAN